MWRTSAFVKGFVGALLGGVLLLAAVHLYTDHAALHVLVNLVNQSATHPAPAVPTP